MAFCWARPDVQLIILRAPNKADKSMQNGFYRWEMDEIEVWEKCSRSASAAESHRSSVFAGRKYAETRKQSDIATETNWLFWRLKVIPKDALADESRKKGENHNYLEARTHSKLKGVTFHFRSRPALMGEEAKNYRYGGVGFFLTPIT